MRCRLRITVSLFRGMGRSYTGQNLFQIILRTVDGELLGYYGTVEAGRHSL